MLLGSTGSLFAVCHMTLLKDLIEIPERIYKDEFVLKLSEGVNDPAKTLSEYVLTPELRTCFEAALAMIGSAVQSRTSKAAFSAWQLRQR